MTTQILLKLAELKSEITTQRVEISQKFKDIDERLRSIEEPLYRIDEREKGTREIAEHASCKADTALRLGWISLGTGTTGTFSGLASIAKLMGLL